MSDFDLNRREVLAGLLSVGGAMMIDTPPAFAGKLRAWPHITLAAMAAKQAGCPVRLEVTRRQLYTSIGFRPHTQQRAALGADQEGHLTASIQEAIGQTSRYEEFAEATLDPAAVTYACSNRRTS